MISTMSSAKQPCFKSLALRDTVISPPLALAPMVGLSHTALRNVILELGGAGLFFTEMLSAKRLPCENENKSPYLLRSSAEGPLFYQVYLNDTEVIAPAVEKLHAIGAEGIDINLGCPAPQLRRQGAGGALVKNHARIRKIISAFRRLTELPVTAKIRLGSSSDDYGFLETCRIIEGEGGDCVTVHARLEREKFCRKPRWSAIAKVKKAITIPVIANGGIFTKEDAQQCLEQSEADGLMIGRGAVHRPWLFYEIASLLYGVVPPKGPLLISNVYQRFIELLQTMFVPEKRLGRLKQFTHYFAASYVFGHHLASAVQNSTSFAEALEKSNIFFEDNEQLTVFKAP